MVKAGSDKVCGDHVGHIEQHDHRIACGYDNQRPSWDTARHYRTGRDQQADGKFWQPPHLAKMQEQEQNDGIAFQIRRKVRRYDIKDL